MMIGLSKKLLALISSLAFIFGATALSANDTYHAPEFNLKERQFDHVKARGENWDTGQRFRVEERPYSDRAIASDKDEIAPEPSRDPSSYEPLELNFETDVQKWRWKDIEHQP